MITYVILAIIQQAYSQSTFSHGVASGDPLANRVIIWTRISPDQFNPSSAGLYQWSLQQDFEEIGGEGSFRVDPKQDYTVKIDVEGLESGTSYYYRFIYVEDTSAVGRMRTASQSSKEELRFGIVSCNNYEAGFFQSFRYLSEKKLDAVIHLGDYIYENAYPNPSKKQLQNRTHDPAKEILTVSEYRKRYAQYRSDPDLQLIHQKHTFITVWDDHESSNNSYKDGADGHDESDGSWEERVKVAKQVYFEWMPIRNYENQKIFRKISYGNLVDIFMLDTRLEGRDAQIYDVANDSLYLADRTILGEEQKKWLFNQWKASKAKWKLIGNQVIYSPLYVGHLDQNVENSLLDIWDGYPAERLQINRFIQEAGIENVVFLTGDFHSSLAFEVPMDDWNFPLTKKSNRDPVAIEFVTPSITSYNFDEILKETGRVKPKFLSKLAVKVLENSIQKDQINRKSAENTKQIINPHLKFIDLIRHGYLVLEVDSRKIEASYYLLKKPHKRHKPEKLQAKFRSYIGENKLERVN